jgi:hypothetical protein
MKMLEVVTGLNVMLKVLQERLIVVLALLLTAGLYGWAMWLQSTLGVIIAGAWGLTIFLPVLYAGSRGATDVQEAAQHPAGES